jgi:hypothetical protein
MRVHTFYFPRKMYPISLLSHSTTHAGSSSSADSSYQPIESDISAMPIQRAPEQKYHHSSVLLDISALEQITPHG